MTTERSADETDRLTVAVALAATYLAVVLNIDSLIGKDPPEFLHMIKLLVQLHFSFVAFLWLLYLLYKGNSLKFYKKDRDLRASDVTVCLVYLVAKLLRKKVILAKSREENEQWFNEHAQKVHTFYYDEALSQSFFLPSLLALVLVPRYGPLLLQRWFGWVQQTALIVTMVLFLVIWLLASLAANVGRFMITGKQ